VAVLRPQLPKQGLAEDAGLAGIRSGLIVPVRLSVSHTLFIMAGVGPILVGIPPVNSGRSHPHLAGELVRRDAPRLELGLQPGLDVVCESRLRFIN
jgi:hypothetical protein